MSIGRGSFPKDFMGRLVKVFQLEKREEIDLFNSDGKRSTQSILPLLAMVFGGGYGKA
jgi:hypothetical protein